MRRIIAALLGLLLVVPLASAQEDNPFLNLDGVFAIPEMGFQFKYPHDWITKSTSTAVYTAENKTDMGALLDGDHDTQPIDYTMSVNWVELGPAGIPLDVKLDDLVDAMAKQQDITDLSSRLEVSVMSYRALSINGINPTGKTGLATLWLQDGYLVILSVGLAVNRATSDDTLGLILNGITPLNTLELSEETLTSPDGDFTMHYPVGWFAGRTHPGVLTELESDLSASVDEPVGIALAILEEPLDEFGYDVKDMNSLAEFMDRLFGADLGDVVTTSDHLILGLPAVTKSGHFRPSNVKWTMMTALIINDKVVLFGTSFPDETRFDAFKPTYLAMLQSITATESET